MNKVIKAFLARSFADEDVARIKPLLDFLKTFERLGFVCVDAEPAEAQLVSHKVQNLIRDSDVFIAFLTRKFGIVDGQRRIVEWRKRHPSLWVPPSWVLQESGFALALGRKLILYVEQGVEVPELHGDYERISFSVDNFEAVFKRTTEMITGIISHHLSLEVIPVIERQKEIVAPPISEASNPPAAEPPKEPSIIPFVSKVFEGIEAKDVSAQEEAYAAGLQHALNHNPKGELVWKVFYHRERAEAGYPDSLAELKVLKQSYPDRYEPALAIARVLEKFSDFIEAANYYEEAAGKATNDLGASFLGTAGACLIQAKKYEDARAILQKALSVATDKQQLSIFSKIYDSYREEGDEMTAIAVAEYSLERNVVQTDLHFNVAYNHNDNFKELATVHYRTVLDQRSDDAAAMNNLAVCFEHLSMPVNAVEWFGEAAKAGNQLASGNLGFRYLNAGFVEAAKSALSPSLREPEPHARVTECLAALASSKHAEDERYKEIGEIAKKHREFFRRMGEGIVNPLELDPSGRWQFPSSVLKLTLSGQELTGKDDSPAPHGMYGITLSALSGDGPELSYEFDGTLERRICKFLLTEKSTPKTSRLFGPSPSTKFKSGYVVFSQNGQSGIVMENTGDEREVYEIQKLDQIPP